MERRRQGQDEPLINFLTVIEEYYECAVPETPGYLRVDHVARQARKEYRNYLFNSRCTNLAELCAAASSIEIMVEAEQADDFPLQTTGCMKPRLKWEVKPKSAGVPAAKSQAAAATSAAGDKPDGKDAGQSRSQHGPRRVGGGQAQAAKPAAPANNAPPAAKGSNDKPASNAMATTSAAPLAKAKGPLICCNCKKEGHISRNCPEANNQ